MAGSLSDIYAALNVIAQALTNLTTNQASIFPHTTASSSSVHAGTVTFNSSQAGGFLVVQTSSGGTVKVPWYPQ